MMIYEEIAKRLIATGKPFDGPNMKAALESIENWDTGGIVGVPVSLKTHSIPIGRVYRANGKTNLLDPVSDWIKIG
jgi:branched-chain amino acid transport system substrate-binding protein